jgi:hypothetical protein
VTVAERDELLDAVEHVERELEAGDEVQGLAGPRPTRCSSRWPICSRAQCASGW